MRVLSLVCSETIIRDVKTNQITAFNVIDDINSVGFPLLLPKLSVYFFSQRVKEDPDNLQVKLTILNNDTQLFSQDFPVNFSNNKMKNKSVIEVKGIVINTSGSLHIKITSIDGSSLYEKEIIVTSRQQAEVVPPENKLL
jgi:hypothetical protein